MAGPGAPASVAPARLVTFEGIDGSGKTTLVAGVQAALGKLGADCVFTREETPTWLGEAVRRSIESGADPLATLYLFLADRAQHLAALRPDFDAGRLVLSDRYHDSTRAYQSVTLAPRFGGAAAFDAWLAAQCAGWLVRPLRTYLVDIDPEAAVQRMDARDETTRYEKAGFLGKVRAEYLRIAAAAPDRFLVLDATRSREALVADVVTDLRTSGLLG